MPDFGSFIGGGAIKIFDGDEGNLRPTDEVLEFLRGRLAKSADFSAGGIVLKDLPKYLIRVDFGSKTSVRADNTGIVSFWQFPKMPNLDMIEQIYVCETPGCEGVMPKETYIGGKWVCMTCKRAWTPRQLGSGMFAYEANMDRWGEIVGKYHNRFGGLCEILMMRRRVSIQEATKRVLAGEKNADVDYMLSHGGTAKTATEAGYFTMKSLHKDTAGGSDVARRIAVFLKGG